MLPIRLLPHASKCLQEYLSNLASLNFSQANDDIASTFKMKSHATSRSPSRSAYLVGTLPTLIPSDCMHPAAATDDGSSKFMHMLSQHQTWRNIVSALQMIISTEKMHFRLEYCISKPKKWFGIKQQQKEIEPLFMKIFPLLNEATINLRNIGPQGVLFLEALQQLQEYMKLRLWLVGFYRDLVVAPFCANKARMAVNVQQCLSNAKENLNHTWFRATIGRNIKTEIQIIYKLLRAQDSVGACQTKDAIVRLHMVRNALSGWAHSLNTSAKTKSRLTESMLFKWFLALIKKLALQVGFCNSSLVGAVTCRPDTEFQQIVATFLQKCARATDLWHNRVTVSLLLDRTSVRKCYRIEPGVSSSAIPAGRAAVAPVASMTPVVQQLYQCPLLPRPKLLAPPESPQDKGATAGSHPTPRHGDSSAGEPKDGSSQSWNDQRGMQFGRQSRGVASVPKHVAHVVGSAPARTNSHNPVVERPVQSTKSRRPVKKVLLPNRADPGNWTVVHQAPVEPSPPDSDGHSCYRHWLIVAKLLSSIPATEASKPKYHHEKQLRTMYIYCKLDRFLFLVVMLHDCPDAVLRKHNLTQEFVTKFGLALRDHKNLCR